MYNNTHNASNIIELQLSVLRQDMENGLRDAVTQEEKDSITSKYMRRFFMSVGEPLMVPRDAEFGHLPYLEDYNTTAQEIYNDIAIAYNELEYIGSSISESFNYSQNEKTKLKNRINALSSMATDFNLISNESEPNVIYFKDSFTNYGNVDTSTSAGTLINISTSEGIATLARVKSKDCNEKASVIITAGNGNGGNYHIAKRANVVTDDDSIIISAKYISDDGANDDPNALIDGRPDTWFEYQMVNINDEDKEKTHGYNISWAEGKECGDKLTLRIVIDLGAVEDINWIDVSPYAPEKSNGRMSVYSIKTSADGIDYESANENGTVINSEVNRISHTYIKDRIFVGNVYSNDKAASQGAFWFPLRKARYIEVIMDQTEPYTETVGHTYYKRVTSDEKGSKEVTVPEDQVPEEIVNGEPGKYPIDKNQYIEKNINLFDGWRYCIGVKDIGAYNYQFADKSEMITIPLQTDKPIKSVMLYSNEVIPDLFTHDLARANDWIQYYISIDDIHWHQISPMHHHPISGATNFPPKMYRVNSREVIEDNIEHPLCGYIYTDESVYGIRLKAVLRRPTDIENSESYTPILEDYSLRIVLEDNSLEGGLL